MKATALRKIRNVFLGVIVLLVVLGGAGMAYAWYSGEHSDDNPNAFASPAQERKTTKRKTVKAAPDAVVSASVQSITSPVVPGSNSSIMVKTNPSAKCSIVVAYSQDGKLVSKDSGLIPKVADEYGLVEWTWTVESSTPLGTWPVKVTCANEKNSAFVQNDLKVVKTLD